MNSQLNRRFLHPVLIKLYNHTKKISYTVKDLKTLDIAIYIHYTQQWKNTHSFKVHMQCSSR